MQFYTASSLSSPVSAQDVSAPSSSSNISFNQYSLPRSDEASFAAPAGIPIAMAKVFITEDVRKDKASAQEIDLIEQSLMRWCSASRMENKG